MAKKFRGFDKPEQNWSKLPHQLIDALPLIETVAEMKCILYILRHTWGFNEFGAAKKITLDEFRNGRKRHDGTRIDNGIGMVKDSIINGLKRAELHGFVQMTVDNSDPGRIEKYYTLTMRAVINGTQMSKDSTPNCVSPNTQMSKDHTPDVERSYPRCRKIRHRTEKETKERNLKKERMDGHSKILDETQSLWQQALADLQLQMPRSTFDAWLLGTQAVEFDGEILRVQVRNALAMEWLDRRLNGKIEQVVANIAGREVMVEFEVKGEQL